MKFICVILLSLMLTAVSAQESRQLYEKGLELAQKGDPEGAIRFFDKSIEMKGDEYVAWYNRGVAKTMLNLHEEAFKDFDQTIKLKPDYKKAYLNRGTARKRLTDYEGAMRDYNFALTLDSNYNDAYYSRGLLQNLLGNRINACLDFEKALKLGAKNAERKMQSCKEHPIAEADLHSILRLSKTAADTLYGFTEVHPIMVGKSVDGGPANEKAYIDLLRDQQGKPVRSKKQATCCMYKSKHALVGEMAMLDTYDIYYKNTEGADQAATLYFSFYDYEEPLLIAGFKTVAPPQ